MYHTAVGLIALVLPKELLYFNSWCNNPVFLPDTVAGWMPVAFIDFGGMCRWHWPLKSGQLDAKSFQNVCKNNLWAAFGSQFLCYSPPYRLFSFGFAAVLPKFEVTVKMPKVITILDEKLKVTVCGLWVSFFFQSLVTGFPSATDEGPVGRLHYISQSFVGF